jgi:hypothetical protein
LYHVQAYFSLCHCRVKPDNPRDSRVALRLPEDDLEGRKSGNDTSKKAVAK